MALISTLFVAANALSARMCTRRVKGWVIVRPVLDLSVNFITSEVAILARRIFDRSESGVDSVLVRNHYKCRFGRFIVARMRFLRTDAAVMDLDCAKFDAT